QLLITAARAASLGLPAQDTRIDAQTLSLAAILAVCDPLADRPRDGNIASEPASAGDSMALKLAKYASLLPALLVTRPSPHSAGWFTVSTKDIQHYIKNPLVDIVQTAQAALPLAGMENSRIMSFRSRHSTSVHLALIAGETPRPPLTRIHSSCVTGDILGSLR